MIIQKEYEMIKDNITMYFFKYCPMPQIIFSMLLNLKNPLFRSIIFNNEEDSTNTKINSSEARTKKCIDDAISWIIYQQSLQPDGGIAGYLTFSRGHLKIGKSYPETTGYTIITLLDYYSLFKSEIAYNTAIKMAEFELKIQNSNGSFNGGTLDFSTGPSVFNTAQIADGILKAYLVSNEKKFLESALSACRWISSVQDVEGFWSRFNYLGNKRVYDTKVSQTLLKADKILNNNEFIDSVEKNLNWVISNQNNDGWFNNCDNTRNLNFAPSTHTIGYTTHGLIECYLIQKNRAWLDSAIKPLTKLLTQFELTNKPLASRYLSDWRPATKSSCITGNAQISLCWLLLYEILDDTQYLYPALKLNDFLKYIQINSHFKEISGALPSSYPIYGDYHPLGITNWTVKYYLDSLILEYKIKNRLSS
jgi:hypothetical protein